MPKTTYHTYEDDRMSFSYPDGFRVVSTTDPGRIHYLVARPGRAVIPGLVIDIMLRERDARSVERMLRTFRPLDLPRVRQLVHRQGEIQGSHFKGFELRTTTEQVPTGPRRTSEWTVLIDFRNIWVKFSLLCEGEMDEGVWTRALDSIQLKAPRASAP